MGIAQGATPYLLLTVEGHDLKGAAAISVTLKTQTRRVTIYKDRIKAATDGEDTVLAVHLKQEETLALEKESADVQVRWQRADGQAYTTEKARIEIYDALSREVF